MTTLKNKVAIVTGSVSGIGRGIAHALAEAGVKLVINSVNSVDAGEQLAAQLPEAIYCQGNIGVEQDCRRLVESAVERFGRLDLLVNNAGQALPDGPDGVLDISNAMFSETLNINVVGTWCLIREALPHLKRSGDGNIVNITACAGIDPASAVSAIPYAIAKAALNHLTKFIAKHAGPDVRCNAIAPGLIMTPRTEGFDEVVNKIVMQTPIKRAGEPQDIAELVLALIKSNCVNGECILADGGFSVV